MSEGLRNLTTAFTRPVFLLTITIVAAATLHFTMPSSDVSANQQIGSASSTTISEKEDSNKKTTTDITKPPAVEAPASTSKLSGAELKAQKKAEKAARRQQEVQAKQVGSAATAPITGSKTEGQSSQI